MAFRQNYQPGAHSQSVGTTCTLCHIYCGFVIDALLWATDQSLGFVIFFNQTGAD
jgi:hypothetical protein